MKGFVGSVLAEPRQAARRSRWDPALALLALLGVVPEFQLAAATVVALPLAIAVWFRKTLPLWTCIGGFLLVAVSVWTLGPERTPEPIGLLVLSYALARWASGLQACVGLGGIVLLGPVVSPFAVSFGADGLFWAQTVTWVLGAIMEALVWFVPFGIGLVVRSRANLHARNVVDARSKEREEFARELHDTVAHHVSAIAIRAQAGQAIATSRPEGAVDALHDIEEAATRTLDEMRQMVKSLRSADDAADLAPQAGIRQIESLAEPTGNPAVQVHIAGDLDALSPTVEASLFRIAQEATTNARRHARDASRIDIRVDADETDVHLVVSDDGRKPASSDKPAGFGLVGMAERVALLDGQFLAAPGRDRGWVVEATVPRTVVSA